MEIFLFIVVILVGLAVFDLIVGVSNDAVNFLNSSIGSMVAPRHIIMLIASLGILAGVTFSSGMMEVARKAIMKPELFSFKDVMWIFLAVMITDIILLDLFNTFGLPTSTTVSIVFELLGASVALAFMKSGGNIDEVGKYINSGKALTIIMGILISVIIAFFSGAFIQFITRMIFTFDYMKRLKRWGAIWGGIALSMTTYVIIIKGAKGASFIEPEQLAWIKGHAHYIVAVIFILSIFVFHMLLLFTKINILKPIILIGTFALAMAFAANDLVNFIGVPLAGLHSYGFVQDVQNPIQHLMTELRNPVAAETYLLVTAGIIMVVTLWVSRKAHSVSKTELSLGRQDEGLELFGSNPLSRVIVRMVSNLFEGIKNLFPKPVQKWIANRFDMKVYDHNYKYEVGSMRSFDLLRASVNLMVASAIVSVATSWKLPLSTTYVTFMVSMGTSLSDRAWGRESAAYRVGGVLTVIGGWFFTAFMAFTVASIFAVILYNVGFPAVFILIAFAAFIIWRNHHLHLRRSEVQKDLEVFNLEKIKDYEYAIATSFKQSGKYLSKISKALTKCFTGIVKHDRLLLKEVSRERKNIQKWANIVVANIFKTLRLLNQQALSHSQKYAQTINAIQEIAESFRDIVMKTYLHVDNHHKPILDVQVDELKEISKALDDILSSTAKALSQKRIGNHNTIAEKVKKLKKLINDFDKNQIRRIQDDTSKTRLSILFYGLVGNAQKIAEQTLNLVKIFEECFMISEKNGKKKPAEKKTVKTKTRDKAKSKTSLKKKV